MYTAEVKLDSSVDVRCDFCNRTGRRGYLLSYGRADRTGSIEILCPGCYEFLMGNWVDDNGWKAEEVNWVHDYDVKGVK